MCKVLQVGAAGAQPINRGVVGRARGFWAGRSPSLGHCGNWLSLSQDASGSLARENPAKIRLDAVLRDTDGLASVMLLSLSCDDLGCVWLPTKSPNNE